MPSWKKLSSRLFGSSASKLTEHLSSLKDPLDKSDLKILLRSYLSIMLFVCFLAFIGSFVGATLLLYFLLGEGLLYSFSVGLGISILVSSATFGLLYLYPIQRARSRAKSIKANLPFAINHMSAIASAKVPPYIIFTLLTEFKEYGEISQEAEKIVRNVDVFGQDISTSLRQAVESTPSDEFEELLEGMIATIETGGNLMDYLEVQADEAMFDYRQRREKYLESLSTYADFYTAVLIAAPLFLIAILAVMNMVGGELMGMGIKQLMRLGIYLAIPIMNTVFIMFIHFTQPEVV